VKLGLVVGKVYSTVKHATFDGARLLLFRPLGLDLKPLPGKEGRVMVGVDTVDAGEGDVVLLLQEGRSARDYLGRKHAATRTMIVAVVDRVDVSEAA
jgi:microcompartment protein CcmK/EutM